MADDDQTRNVNKYLHRAMADPMVIFLFTALAKAYCLFFHAQQASDDAVRNNTQNHAGMLGHLIYGCTPSKREEQEYFTFLHRHINSISAPVVDLTTFLDESTVDWYNEMELQQHPKLQ